MPGWWTVCGDKTNEDGKEKPLPYERIGKESFKKVLLACFKQAFDGELYAELEAEMRLTFTDVHGPV